MSYVTSEKLLSDAQKNKYAVPAFNAENMEMVMAIVSKCEEMRSPAIIQTTPSTLKYAMPDMFKSMVKSVAEKATVPVSLHLDHGNSFNLVKQCLKDGYSSIMIDGSKQVLEENIRITKEVVDYSKRFGIPVEGELGCVGGKEDDTVGGDGYTVPGEAVEFVGKTGVDFLAVGIGTAHGVYKSEPKLDVNRLKEIRKLVSIPLVLHGASGLSDNAVKECIKNGICKVNIATELRQAFTRAVREFLEADKTAFDPKKYGVLAIESVKETVGKKILMCGSNNRV